MRRAILSSAAARSLGAGLLALLAGCASQAAPEMGQPGPDDRFVLNEIHRSAGSIDRHIRDLERASLRNIHVRRLPPPTGAAAERVTLDYDGPVEEAVQAVARMITTGSRWRDGNRWCPRS